MKVLFVLEHYHPYIGGAERIFQLLAEALAEKGYQVRVVTTRFDKQLPKKENHRGVEIIRVDCYNRFLFTFFSLPKVIRFARQSDVVHTTTYNAAFPAWIGARLTRKKAIVTFHEVWGPLWFQLPFISGLLKRAYYYYERLVLALPFDIYIAVSKFTEKALAENGIPSSKITQIYNGLYYDRFSSYQHQAPDQFTCTYFGRLGISKGLNLLIPAFKLLVEKRPESQLVLILPRQPVAMLQTIQSLIEDHQLDQYVRIRHELSRDELYQQISRSSCVAIPSYSEGFCFVAAETVALGVPIISSQRGALAEVVSGQYIEMEAMTSESLFKALVKASAGEWQEKAVRYFEMDKAVVDYLRLYEKLNGQKEAIQSKKASEH